jgi:hypothetical protein
VGALLINGVLTTNFRRFQPLFAIVMARQADSPTARAQAALPPRGQTNADRWCDVLVGPRETPPDR